MTEAEREIGQRLLIDVAFEVTGCDATVTDRVEDTVDYADACEQVALAAQERSYRRSSACARPSPSGWPTATAPTRCA